jgi:hypothetical protein
MLTFLVLLISAHCCATAQRQGHEGSLARGFLAAGLIGMAAALGLSMVSNGIERGIAMWLICLMAAGLVAPFLGTQVPRVQAAARWSRARLLATFGAGLEASSK